MATLNPFKTLTCHACLHWIQKSLDPEDRYHNEERDAEEEFKFMGIPIAGENEGDSEESWERESWDTGDDNTTDKDSLKNHFQWATWDTNEASKQREQSPWTLPPSITDDLAFQVGPRKDGIVQTRTKSPLLLTTNYYHLLADDTEDYHPVPVSLTSTQRTWFSTRADELHRLVVGKAFTSVTNAQKLAHPWKTTRQETNRKHKKTLDRILDA
jgi:hypothetical protein